MNMKNNKKFLTVLLILALCITMVFSLIACDPVLPDAKDPVSDEGKYISNGNFENTASTDVIPMTPSSWSHSAGSTASDNETPVDDKSLVSGVIDTSDEIYESNKSTWDRIANPGAIGDDSNVLMIYNRKDNSYKYTSNSFSLTSNKHFEIKFSVKTVNMEDHGGYVSINGDTKIEYDSIDTKGTWVTYTAMIETSNVASNSLSITASNGRLGSEDGMLSKGYMFVDDITVTEVDAVTYNNSNDDGSTNRKASLLLGDSSFENTTGTDNPYSASEWAGVSSVGADGETAPTGSDYLERGIVDTNSNTSLPDSATGISAMDGFDSNFLMIDNKKPTAYGYRSDNKIRFNASNEDYYKLSVWILTDIDNAEQGAYIQLKSSTDKDEDPIIILDNINTGGEWKQVSIYIKPDAVRYKDLYIQVGLGTGGKNDKDKIVQGTAFFDEITLETLATLPEGIEDTSDNYEDLTAVKREEEITAPYEIGDYSHAKYDDKDGLSESQRGKITKETASADSWNTNLGVYPGTPTDANNPLMTVHNAQHNATSIKYTPTTIEANNYYRLSMWIKTDIVNKNSGLNIQLYEKAKQEDGTTTTEDTLLTSIDNFNTQNISDLDNNSYNDYTEVVFLIESDIFDPSNIYFQFQLGSGDQFTSPTHVKGSAYITQISLTTVKYSDYNSESGDYVKKHSFSSVGGTIANNDFNSVDLANTEKHYNDLKPDGAVDFDENKFLNGNGNGIFALPSDWTFTSSDELDKMNAGVLNIKNDVQLSALGFKPYTVNENILSTMPPHMQKDNHNVLAINNKDEILNGSEEDYTQWGFTSPSISLSKNTYYEISVWAYIESGNASINLKSSSKSTISSFSLTSNTTAGWNEYKFYVETGFDDFTSYLELAIGENTANNKDHNALFDMPSITKISEESYNAGVNLSDDEQSTDTYNSITFTTTNFDNNTESDEEYTLNTPANWSGKHVDSDSPNGEHESIAGVYNRDHSNRNWFGGEGNTAEDNVISDSDLLAIMNSVPNIDGIGTEGTTNDNILVINNHLASEYTYTTTLADNALVAESYYEISIMIRTYNLAADDTAIIELKLHNDIFKFSLNEAKGIKVNHDKWVKYSFYIQTGEDATIDDVELSVKLGTEGEDNYVAGYLFADNVTINKIDEDTYNANAPEIAFTEGAYDTTITNTTHRVFFEKNDLKNPEVEVEDDSDPLLWLYISSGVLGGLVLLAVIVVGFRKFHIIEKMFPKNKDKKKATQSYNRDNIDANKSSTFTKDINKPDRE